MTALVLLVLAAAGIAAGGYLASLWLHPWAPCQRCDGGRKPDPVWKQAYGTCRSCGGRGRKPRTGVRILQPGRARKLTGMRPSHKSVDQRKG